MLEPVEKTFCTLSSCCTFLSVHHNTRTIKKMKTNNFFKRKLDNFIFSSFFFFNLTGCFWRQHWWIDFSFTDNQVCVYTKYCACVKATVSSCMSLYCQTVSTQSLFHKLVTVVVVWLTQRLSESWSHLDREEESGRQLQWRQSSLNPLLSLCMCLWTGFIHPNVCYIYLWTSDPMFDLMPTPPGLCMCWDV